MCIAIPMIVTEVLDDNRVMAQRPGKTCELDASFSADPVKAGDWVLVFRNSVLRTVSKEEARKVEEALICVENAMRTDTDEGVDAAFGDIIENSGKLPPHLQALVGKPL